MAYDTNNIFARIVRGEIPCHKVYEDADTLAFMDIMPQAEGHTLVIPKNAGRTSMGRRPTPLPPRSARRRRSRAPSRRCSPLPAS